MMGVVIRALAGGRLVAARPWIVRRLALVWLAASGCFYIDPINQRPSLDIEQTSGDVVYRGDTVRLRAIANDPDGHDVWFRWRATSCNNDGVCDVAPFYEASDDFATFAVPMARNDEPYGPVRTILVVLEGQDELGAFARPDQRLVIPVADRAPTLELGKDSRYGYVVSTKINVFAKVGDPDDGPDVVTLDWEVFTPMDQPTYTLEDITVEQDSTATKRFGKQFRPAGIGNYEIRVTARDMIGEQTVKSLMINVGPDMPPCLRTLSPVVAPAGSVLPMTEPTLFQVHVVADDLDPYPSVSDPELGTTAFSWSVKTNSGVRELLDGVTGNHVALDPASYHPGDIVEVRVEIADRKQTAITCDQADATCSVISDNTCIQRQTWRVEVR